MLATYNAPKEVSYTSLMFLEGNLISRMEVVKKKNNWLPLKRHPAADPLGQHYRIVFFFFFHFLTFDKVTQGAQSPPEV